MKNYKKHMDQTKKAYSLVASDFGASRANPWFEFEIYKRNLKPGAKFLDLGCGNARLAKFLPKNITGKITSVIFKSKGKYGKSRKKI